MEYTPSLPQDAIAAADRARMQLRELIRSGQIRSGQRIDQREVARRLKLTTAPLREALSALEGEGLVERVPGVGVFCKASTVDEIEEMIEVRGALEGLAAGRAAVRIGQQGLARLYDLARLLSDPAEFIDKDTFVQRHVEFHTIIAEMAGGEHLGRLLKQHRFIWEVLGRIAPSLWPVEPHDHVRVVDAIASGDAARAEQVMRAHIAPTFAERLHVLRRQFGNRPVLPTD